VVTFNAVFLSALAWAAAVDRLSPSANAITFAHAVVLAGIAQLLVTGAGCLRLPLRMLPLQFGFAPETRHFFTRAVPGLIAAGIPQMKLIAGAMIASSSPAAVSWLYYANRLYELPLGVASIATASVLVPAVGRPTLRRRSRAASRSRSAWRFPRRSPSRCWRSRSRAPCSNVAHFAPAIPPQWRRH
jgi:putative peptidoglycan lipid II flippase